MDICDRHFNNRFYRYQLCTRLFEATTGFRIDDEHLRRDAVMIWNTIKKLNIIEGFGRADDEVPEIWFTPMSGTEDQPFILRDYFGNTELSKEDISQLVEDYYDERGWNTNGLV